MRLFSAILLIAAIVLTVAVAPASAGYKDQWVKFRTTMTDKTDSKALCYIFMPWPWKCACDVDSDGDGVPDSMDKCPGTPAGTRVDKNGCPIDSDNDGVPDGIDQCPNTPAGVKVDAKGCPIDSDNDGVPDGIDQCPNTPAGATVDARGCPTDSDNDGVWDGIDQCPNTPAGAKVDARGCPMDSDNDGVWDGIDQCPNTPAGTKVDETGCPVEVRKFIDTGLISSTDIMFDFDKATLKPESKAPLDAIGKILIQVPDLKVEVGGHTDAIGTDAYNLKLSDARAKSVRDYLLNNFPQIKADNLSSKGYGESKPVATNDTKEGQAKNRRVEFRILR
jgi:outer membrane protein OmpA-like peptidoglycan-associated protein